MSHNPLLAVLDQIVAGGLGFTKGTNAFQGPIRGPDANIPIRAIFVTDEGGVEPQRFMGQVAEVRDVLVSVLVRWNKFAAGQEKSRAIQNSLQADTLSGYLDLMSMQGSPIYLGMDDEAHHKWLLQFGVTFEEVA